MVRAQLGGAHVGVAVRVRQREAAPLEVACQLHARADGGRRLAQTRARQLLVVHARHLHMDVEAIQQRPRDTLLVARHHRGRADTHALGVAVPAAWTHVRVAIVGEVPRVARS